MMRYMDIEEVDIEIILSTRSRTRKGEIFPADDGQNQKEVNGIDVKGKEADDAEIDEENFLSTGRNSESRNEQEHVSTTTLFDLEHLVEKYGDKKLRVVDSIPRKSGHLLTISVFFLQLHYTTNTVLTQLQTLCIVLATIFLMLAFFYNYQTESWAAKNIFALSRIRDGRYGRLNFLTAFCVGSIGALVVMLIIIYGIVPHIEHPSSQLLIVNLVYAPLIVGDAMGELVGGPFGGTFFPTFQVRGLGEINRKSVEGCFAVFVGSLVACVGVCYLYGNGSSYWIILGLALAVLTTFVETLAFRSTDNFFIPVMNAFAVLLTFRVFRDSFQQ